MEIKTSPNAPIKKRRYRANAWNKGLTKETDERVKKYSETIKKNPKSFQKGVYSGFGFKRGDDYGLTKLEKKEKIAGRKKPEQCEICGAFASNFKKGLCFDHDHSTGEFRGWICTRCNVALAMVNDKVEILELLIKYLKKNEN